MPVSIDHDKNVTHAPTLVSSARTASANGTGVDLAGYSTALCILSTGVITDGTHTPKIQESNDNSTWNDVAASDQSGTFTALTSGAGGSATQGVAYTGSKRYIRGVMTVSGATTGGLYSFIIVKALPRTKPAA